MRSTSRNGHFLGWRMVAVGGLGVFLAGPAQTYGVSVFVDPMRAEFGWSRSQISIAYSIATLVGALAVIVSGRMLDRYGHRLFLSVTALGFGAALMVMSVVADLISLTVGYALLRGFGIGALLLASRTLASQWFVRQRGRALSLVAVGGSLSLALVPLANTVVIERFNWRDAWRLDAIIVWIVLLPIAAVAVRSRPEDAGQLPDGTSAGPLVLDAPVTQGDAEIDWEPGDAMRTRAFWSLLGASMVPGLVITALDFNQISILTANGLSSSIAASVFTVSAVAALIASLAAGWLIDKRQPRFVLSAGLAALMGAMLIALVIDSTAAAVAYGVTRGIALGMWAVAIDATWPAFFGRRRLGSIRSIAFAAEIVGAALGPIPFAVIYDATNSYAAAILGLVVLPIAATLAILSTAEPVPLGPRQQVDTAGSITA